MTIDDQLNLLHNLRAAIWKQQQPQEIIAMLETLICTFRDRDQEVNRLKAITKVQSQQIARLGDNLHGVRTQFHEVKKQLIMSERKNVETTKYFESRNLDLTQQLSLAQTVTVKDKEKLEQKYHILIGQNKKLQKECERMKEQLQNLIDEKTSADQQILYLYETLMNNEEELKTMLSSTKTQILQYMEQVEEGVHSKAHTLQTHLNSLSSTVETQKGKGDNPARLKLRTQVQYISLKDVKDKKDVKDVRLVCARPHQPTSPYMAPAYSKPTRPPGPKPRGAFRLEAKYPPKRLQSAPQRRPPWLDSGRVDPNSLKLPPIHLKKVKGLP